MDIMEKEPTVEEKASNSIEILLDDHKRKVETGEHGIIDVEKIEINDLVQYETIGGVTSITGNNEISIQKDHYNPTKLQSKEGHHRIAIRQESRGIETDSTIEFYEKDGDGPWQLVEGAPVLPGHQDPFFVEDIQGQSVFGAVKIFPKPDGIGYLTEFYKYDEHLSELTKFAESPVGHKDIRLVDRKNGKIGVFIRPQEGKHYPGKIGYLEIESLDDLTEALADFENRATIFENFFADGEWGGVNSAHLLEDGRIAVYGHIARKVKDEHGNDQKEYYAMSAIFDPETNEITPPEIYLTQEELEVYLEEKFPNKNPEIKSVYFSGGVVRNKGTDMKDCAGVGDTSAISATLKDPIKVK